MPEYLHGQNFIKTLTSNGIEIIPAVNAISFEEVQRKVSQIESHAKWVHIDVADGTFTDNVLWHNPVDLAFLKTELFIEIHLMLDDIDAKLKDWLLPNVRRNIFHVEAAKNPEALIAACHAADIFAGIAIKPNTSWEALKPYVNKADLLQVLGVIPGKSGQTLQKNVIQNIRALRGETSSCFLEIDGGVNVETAAETVEAGANVLVAGSAIFNASDPARAIEELKKAAKNIHAET